MSAYPKVITEDKKDTLYGCYQKDLNKAVKGTFIEVVKLQKIPPQEGLSEDTLDVLQITISEITKHPWLMAFLSTMLT